MTLVKLSWTIHWARLMCHLSNFYLLMRTLNWYQSRMLIDIKVCIIVWCRFVHLFFRYIYPHSTYPHVSCTSDDDHRAVWPDSLQRVWQGAHQGAAPARQVTGPRPAQVTSDWWRAGHVTSVLTSDWCSGSCWTTRRGASRLTTAACGCWTSRRRCSPGTGCLTRVIYGPDTGCFIRTSSDASDHGSSPKRCGSGSAAARLRRWMSSE